LVFGEMDEGGAQQWALGEVEGGGGVGGDELLCGGAGVLG
jgi:hypothetical protein